MLNYLWPFFYTTTTLAINNTFPITKINLCLITKNFLRPKANVYVIMYKRKCTSECVVFLFGECVGRKEH